MKVLEIVIKITCGILLNGCPLERGSTVMILSNYDYLRSVSDTTSADSKLVPTGRVIGIIKRNWRQYCGILQPSALKDSVRHLFIPAEKKIPRVRIETRQVSMFNRTKLICSYLQEFHDAV